jgi:ABC-type siderophore export system fused ATPase/permease subunit
MNLWRLLSARMREGRIRLLAAMCLVALMTGAVIIGLSERLASHPVWEMPAGLAGALLVMTIAGYGQFRIDARIGRRLAGLPRQIRRAIIAQYVALEPPALAEIDQDAMRDALIGVPRGLAHFGTELPAAVQSYFIMLVCVAATLLINPVAGAALLLAMKLGAIAMTALIVLARRHSVAAERDDAIAGHAMDDTFKRIRHARLAGAAPSSGHQTPLEAALTAHQAARPRRLAWIATGGAAGAIGRPLLAALVGGATRLSGEAPDQAIAMMLIAFLIPLDWIAAIPHFATLSAAADRLAAFEAALQSAARRWATPRVTAGREFASLELQDAVFRYPGQPGVPGAVVGPVSCRVAPGQILFVTGGIGAGKTTLLLGFVGFWAPEGGTVLRDGSPVDARRNRDLAAFVATDPVLFGGMPVPNIDRPEVQRLVEELELSGFDAIRSGRVPNVEGLSRAVRARIALLIAIASDRPMIVLDEWEESQSPSMRDRYYHSILPGLRHSGRAVIVSAANERHSGTADQIIRLVDGRQI